MTAPTVNEKILVQNADNMDRETFCLHMTHRHNEHLGGMHELNPHAQSEYTEVLWRKFHDKLHSPIFPLAVEESDHEHE